MNSGLASFTNKHFHKHEVYVKRDDHYIRLINEMRSSEEFIDCL